MNALRRFHPFLRPLALASISTLIALSATGCNGCNSANSAATTAADNGAVDPAQANMAEGTGQPTAVLGQSASYEPQQNGQAYPPDQTYQQGAPVEQNYPAQTGNDSYNAVNNANDSGYNQGEATQQDIDTTQAPPPLPEYDQPPAPDENDLWTPGYWAWGSGGYYWVPGAWVAAPYYGSLWTPPYWGWYGGHYWWHHGYWGPHVGFYGGINYGFGYIGVGYFGGYWHGHDFYYNRAVNHVPGGWGANVVYNRPVVYNNVHYGMQPNVRTSFNGPNGVQARPQSFEVAAMHEQHMPALAPQVQARQAAMANRGQFFAENHGRPAITAAPHPYVAAGGIHEAPANVHPGRPGMNGVPGPTTAARPMEGARPGQPKVNEARPGQPVTEARPAGAIQRPGEPVNNTRPGFENRPGQPAVPTNNAHPEANAARPTPEMNRPAPQVHTQPAPQQHVQPSREVHTQPEQQSHPQPAAQPRPEVHQAPPQMHAAPAPRPAAPAPRPAPAARPAPPAPAPHAAPPSGGGHDEHR